MARQSISKAARRIHAQNLLNISRLAKISGIISILYPESMLGLSNRN